ncbi:MAG: hypothetical protein P4L50_00690, partial [Anaerolineaceae bacterium]|nr:hypothetical protein [Anaerolineaceae bacterium]
SFHTLPAEGSEHGAVLSSETGCNRMHVQVAEGASRAMRLVKVTVWKRGSDSDNAKVTDVYRVRL